MKAAERKHRDHRIATRFLQGETPEMLARSYDRSERHVRRIIKAERERHPRMFETDAHETLEELLDRYDASIEEFALIGITSNSDNAKLKAINGKLRAMKQKKCLMDEAGLLPRFEPPTLINCMRLAIVLAEILRHFEIVRPEVEFEITEALAHFHNGSLWRYQLPPQADPTP